MANLRPHSGHCVAIDEEGQLQCYSCMMQIPTKSGSTVPTWAQCELCEEPRLEADGDLCQYHDENGAYYCEACQKWRDPDHHSQCSTCEQCENCCSCWWCEGCEESHSEDTLQCGTCERCERRCSCWTCEACGERYDEGDGHQCDKCERCSDCCECGDEEDE